MVKSPAGMARKITRPGIKYNSTSARMTKKAEKRLNERLLDRRTSYKEENGLQYEI